MSQNIKGYQTFYFLGSLFLVVASLHLAREILVPLALAILISFILGPIVIRVEKIGLGRIASVVVVTLFAFSTLFGIGWIVGEQVADLSSELPTYKQNLLQRIKIINSSATHSLSAFRRAFQEISEEISAGTHSEHSQDQGQKSAALVESKTLGSAPQSPLWTTTVEPPRSPLAIIRETLQPIIWPVASSIIIVVLVVFILVHREDLRDRLIRLIGEGRLTITTEALDEAAVKLSRYLSMQFLVNCIFGLCITFCLWLLGISNAPVWGLLSFCLRFIPYIGAWIAAALPILFALAGAASGWAPLNILLVFAIIELITGNVIEPFLLSRSTGITPIAVLMAAVFWTWIWGPLGLLLSTPLTVCLVVVGKYVPVFQFATIILSDRPALEPYLRLYQRLLASHQEEAFDIMYETLKQSSLSHFYQEVVIPTLLLAESDRAAGIVDEQKLKLVRSGMRHIIEEAYEYQQQKSSKNTSEQEAASVSYRPKAGIEPQKVLLLPCRDEADELCAMAVSYLLQDMGHIPQVLAGGSLANEMSESISEHSPDVVVVSALPPSAISNTKYLLKKIKQKHLEFPTIVGFWNAPGAIDKAKLRIGTDSATYFVSSIDEALAHIEQLALLEN